MNKKYFGIEEKKDENNNSIFNTYIVKKGDSLYRISQENNIDLNTLIKINGLDPNEYIYPNQILLIPKIKYKTYITEDNDTLYLLSKKLSRPIGQLLDQNENIYLLPEQLIIYKD